MCLIALNWQPESDVPLVVAANRDEFHRRPALPLHRWSGSGIVAGRDQQAGGTWLGVTPEGRFAAVTNFRLPGAPKAPRSRGTLPVRFLEGDDSPEVYTREIWDDRREYGPFSLLAGDRDSLWYVSSHNDGATSVAPGVHVLSNHLLDTPWPKVSRIRARLGDAADCDIVRLLDLLRDTEPAEDHELPDTGLARETERLLSAPFVRSAEYGTRSSLALVMDARIRMAERSYDPEARVRGEIAWEFTAC